MRGITDFIKERPLIPVLAAAVIIRLIYLFIYLSSPQWNQIMVDSLFHDRWARAIAGGDFWGHEVFFRAPLYIYLLAGIYALFGHSFLAARIFGHLLGLFSILFTYKLTDRLASKKAAAIAAAFHAFYPIAIYFEGELLSETLFMMLVEWSLLLFISGNGSNRNRTLFLSGIAIGLAAITRALILPLTILYFVWIFLKKETAAQSLKSAAILAAAIIIPILPVTVRNYAVSGQFVTVAASGGVNFYIGNNGEADGLSASLPSIGPDWQIGDLQYLARVETGRNLSASEMSDFWLAKGTRWILDHKGDFIRLYIKRLYFCLNNFEVSNNRNLAYFFSQNPLLHYNPLNFSLILSLAAMGLAGLIISRRFNRSFLFLSLFAAGYLLLISLFFINSRFRLPVIPIVFLFGAIGIIDFAERVGQRKVTLQTILLPALGLLAFWFSHTNFYRIDRVNSESGLFNEANFYLAKGDFENALAKYRDLLVKNPRYPEVNLNLGAAFMKTGLTDSAEVYFRKELQFFPEEAQAYSNLASLYYLKNRPLEADSCADMAINLKPNLPDGYLVKVRILNSLNRADNIGTILSEAEKYIGKFPRLWLDAGIIYSEHGEYEKAISCLSTVISAEPEAIESGIGGFDYSRDVFDLGRIKGRAYYQLGYIYGIKGNLQQSIAMSNRAIALDSNQIEAYINLGHAYIVAGEIAQARSILDSGLKRFPNNEYLLNLLRLCK
ncbi:conserved membrane hypothetical protein [Candidatus Zixiibacteriota bacterium]|nr:conserved membrane hypothetical protein [candidate division Zixibacteria bacterium]